MKTRPIESKKKKLPVLTVAMWLEAERASCEWCQEKPPDAVTVEEYAKAMGFSPGFANKLLKEKVEAGKMIRKPWRDGRSGKKYLYFLK